MSRLRASRVVQVAQTLQRLYPRVQSVRLARRAHLGTRTVARVERAVRLLIGRAAHLLAVVLIGPDRRARRAGRACRGDAQFQAVLVAVERHVRYRREVAGQRRQIHGRRARRRREKGLVQIETVGHHRNSGLLTLFLVAVFCLFHSITLSLVGNEGRAHLMSGGHSVIAKGQLTLRQKSYRHYNSARPDSSLVTAASTVGGTAPAGGSGGRRRAMPLAALSAR